MTVLSTGAAAVDVAEVASEEAVVETEENIETEVAAAAWVAGEADRARAALHAVDPGPHHVAVPGRPRKTAEAEAEKTTAEVVTTTTEETTDQAEWRDRGLLVSAEEALLEAALDPRSTATARLSTETERRNR